VNHLLNFEIPPKNLNCTSCGQESAQYRCLDCYGPHWWCQRCILEAHVHHPFHRPQQWKDGSFEKVPLCDMGYVLVLGHSSQEGQCPEDNDIFGDRRMAIVHVNGVFEHCVRFCKCKGASSEHEQLFMQRLFPSTFDRPETAFTMDVLDYYGIDSMECKTSAQSFFQKLCRVTNNAFPDQIPVRSSFHFNKSDSNITKEPIPGIDQGKPPDEKARSWKAFWKSIWRTVIPRKSLNILSLLSSARN